MSLEDIERFDLPPGRGTRSDPKAHRRSIARGTLGTSRNLSPRSGNALAVNELPRSPFKLLENAAG